MQGTTWLGAARSFTVLVALGGALPYGTLSPCWCRKHLKNRTSFHDAYTQPARAGSGPAFSFLSSRVSKAPRHIKTARSQHKTTLVRRFSTGRLLQELQFCISSISFFVVLAVHVITSARRTVRFGYLERVFALFTLYTALAGGIGLSASCEVLHFFCFV